MQCVNRKTYTRAIGLKPICAQKILNLAQPVLQRVVIDRVKAMVKANARA